MVAHPLWGMSMIVPIVGNTDREFWLGCTYFGGNHRPDPIGIWWGYYGNWAHKAYYVEPFLHGRRESYKVFADEWTGVWK